MNNSTNFQGWQLPVNQKLLKAHPAKLLERIDRTSVSTCSSMDWVTVEHTDVIIEGA